MASDIADWASPMGGLDELGAAIQAAGCTAAADSTRVGYWLRYNKDRVASGLKLEKVKAVDGSALWQLREINQAAGDAGG